jgi:cell division protein FtsB
MVGLIKKERETSRNKAAELAKINEFRKRQALLSTEIEKLNTPQGIEESVRDKFQVVKPGEREVLIIQDQESAQSSDTLADHSFWGYIKRLFNRKK